MAASLITNSQKRLERVFAMAARGFPSPPELSQLLKFFECEQTQARKELLAQKYRPASSNKASTNAADVDRRRQSGAGRSKSTPRASTHGSAQSSALFQRQAKQDRSKSSTSTTHRGSPSHPGHSPRRTCLKDDHTRPVEWNGSTQVPAFFTKPLRHQILSKTFEPPLGMSVNPSGADEIVQRVSKATVSSKMKEVPGQDAWNRESGLPTNYSASAANDGPADTRAKDAIQTLLQYRKEVEKRLAMGG